MTLLTFDSMSALADYAAANNSRTASFAQWAGGEVAECVRKTRDGDLALVAASEGFLARFESLTFQSPRKQWLAAEAGHMPNVPAFIAGHPQSMRRRARRLHEAAPITVLVDVGVSEAFSHEKILTRGAAIMALCRVLASYRAVQLYVVEASKVASGAESVIAVRIDSAPLDLAHAAWALCGAGFLRQIMLPIQVAVLRTERIPVYRGSLAAATGVMLPHGTCVIEVPGTSSAITSDPAAWIEARIREAAPEVLGEAA